MGKTIGEVISKLKECDQDLSVLFGFGHCAPTKVDSWRGIYSDPALGWVNIGHGGEHSILAPTVKELVAELESSIDGKFFYGYKGGKYRYTEDSQLHIDSYGDCSNTEISQIEVSYSCVIIHTVIAD